MYGQDNIDTILVVENNVENSIHNKATDLQNGQKNYTSRTKRGIIRSSVECTRIRE